MAGKANAWMPLYIGDYLADTMHLNGAQHGGYLLLLMHQWRTGPLPKDEAQLAAIARADPAAWRKSVWPVLRGFFQDLPEGYSQKRLAAEAGRVAGIKEKRAEAGGKGAETRWRKDGKCHPVAIDRPSPGRSQKPRQKMAIPQSQSETAPQSAQVPARGGMLDFGQHVTPDPKTGKPMVNGWELDTVGETILEAAGIDRSRWRGDFRPVIGWLRDDLDPGRIVALIRKRAASPSYSPPSSLQYFDRAVRQNLTGEAA